MSLSEPLDSILPPYSPELKESEWIHTTSVTGPYGITASVKDWNEVIDWQEHHRSLTQGYYRLIPTPQVREVTTRLEAQFPGFYAVAISSGALAHKELKNACEVSGNQTPIEYHVGLPLGLEVTSNHVLEFSSTAGQAGIVLTQQKKVAELLFERNRRRGGALSSRVAQDLLHGGAVEIDIREAENCAENLCEWEQANHAFFYPSGMAAVTAALEHVLTQERNRMIVLGNVYRDTHLLLEEQPWAGIDVQTDFLDTHDHAGLKERIQDPSVAGVLIETITNPLIEIPDLPGIAAICKQAKIPLLVDSTMAGPLNATPLTLGAEVLIHSTSKYLSGQNTHGGGVILTSNAQRAESIHEAQQKTQNLLAPVEFSDLNKGIATYPERLNRFNQNGEAVADLLRNHPAVDTVFYAADQRPEWLKGMAGVVSCELKDPSLEKVATFFDAPLPGILKAPSLGSDQTLFCPYVLLAYYDKSDEYLRESNLSKTLLRFAMGSEENIQPVLDGIRIALDALQK